MSSPHVCQRCGASCEGLRVRVEPGERASLEVHAAELGVPRPVVDGWIRQSWGRCVFYEAGCRLHSTFGPAAKPSVCRTFPRLGGDIDPACFHPGEPGGPGLEVDWDDLGPGLDARVALDRLPLAAVLDGPVLGPSVSRALEPLVRAAPAPVAPVDRERIARQARVVVVHELVPQVEPARAVLGGAQLLAGAGVPVVLAPWLRLLKLGLFGR
ncbi:MAG: YkgJ family cysteine cluster protein [Myxococcales bacterium]|nr:YkgJ family cysteine cluster protein [Myxococcales bacterium]